MEIIYKKIEELKDYEYNPRKNKKAVNAVAKSIKQFGFKNPVIIDINDIIICGHTRKEAAKKLKMKEIPCILADDLTEEEIKAYRIVDNRTAEMAEWDEAKLQAELQELIDVEFDMDDYFDIPEQDINLKVDNFNEDEAMKNMEEPKIKINDIYILGNHRLMCGDCTNKENVKNLLLDEYFNFLVFTDPPYGIDIVGSDKQIGENNKAKVKKYNDVIGDESTKTAENFYKLFKELGFNKFIIFGGNYFLDFLDFPSNWIVWDKTGEMARVDFADGELAYTNFKTPLRIFRHIWKGMIQEGKREARIHPTQKPIKLIADIIEYFNKDKHKWDCIFDCFGGSGSILMACEQLNIKCFMMELSPQYCQVIINRWEDFTGKKAELMR